MDTAKQTLLLDVDYTLYPPGTGPFKLVRERIAQFVMEKLSLDAHATRTLRNRYIQSYGCTLGGLMQDYDQEPHAFLRYVHDVPIESLLARDERLASILSGISIPVIAFSNGSRPYIDRVLTALGVQDYFQRIFTIEDMDFIPKPKPDAYHKIIEIQAHSPQQFMLVDDMQDNIDTARALGMTGVLLGLSPMDNGPMISDIYDLPRALEAFLNGSL